MRVFPEGFFRGIQRFLAPQEYQPPVQILAESFEDFKRRASEIKATNVSASLDRDQRTAGILEHSVTFSAIGSSGTHVGYTERYEEGRVNADPKSPREQAITKRLLFTADQRLLNVSDGITSLPQSQIYIGFGEYSDLERENLRKYAKEHSLEQLTPIVNTVLERQPMIVTQTTLQPIH